MMMMFLTQMMSYCHKAIKDGGINATILYTAALFL